MQKNILQHFQVGTSAPPLPMPASAHVCSSNVRYRGIPSLNSLEQAL